MTEKPLGVLPKGPKDCRTSVHPLGGEPFRINLQSSQGCCVQPNKRKFCPALRGVVHGILVLNLITLQRLYKHVSLCTEQVSCADRPAEVRVPECSSFPFAWFWDSTWVVLCAYILFAPISSASFVFLFIFLLRSCLLLHCLWWLDLKLITAKKCQFC